MTSRIGTNGSTSIAPIRGCSPWCVRKSIVSTAFLAARKAASATPARSPTNVSTDRLWSASLCWSKNFTPGTALISAAIPSTTARRRPSLKLGTHSMIMVRKH